MLDYEPPKPWQSVPVTAAHSSRGHHLPPETITVIVQYLPYDKAGKIQKQGLANASLTCRYWAYLLQPAMFRDLTLQGPEDVTQALDFIDSPSTSCFDSLAGHIQEITYRKTDDRFPPWARLHILHKRVPHAKLHLVASAISNEKDKHVSGSTLLQCLPRTLPSTAFPPFSRLELHRVGFKAPGHLVRLVHTFSKLRECTFASLAFQPTPEPIPTATTTRRRTVAPAEKLDVDLQLPRPPTNFTTQLQLAFAVIDAKRTLSVPEETWRIFEEAVTALVPSDIGVGDARVDLTSMYTLLGCRVI